MLSIEELITEISSVRQQSQQLAAVVRAANQELGQHSAQSCLSSAAGEIRVLESGEWVPEEAVKGGWS